MLLVVVVVLVVLLVLVGVCCWWFRWRGSRRQSGIAEEARVGHTVRLEHDLHEDFAFVRPLSCGQLARSRSRRIGHMRLDAAWYMHHDKSLQVPWREDDRRRMLRGLPI
jgi:hypothetical protein